MFIEAIKTKKKKSLSEKLAIKIGNKKHMYKKGQSNSPNLIFYEYKDGCYCPIKDLMVFIRECAKPEERMDIDENVVKEIVDYWLEPGYGFPPNIGSRDPRYVSLNNGWYDILKGNFSAYNNFRGKYCPGYQRFRLQAVFLKPKKLTDAPQQSIKARSLGQLLTGFRLPRNIIWCCDSDYASFLESVLRSSLPEKAVFYLSSTALKPEFKNACENDSHCVVVPLSEAKELTLALWGKLKVLSDSKKPTLIVAPFFPFIPKEMKIDIDWIIKALLIIKPDTLTTDIFPEGTQNDLNQIVSAALSQLHSVICSVYPDTCPNAERIGEQPDFNDVKGILKMYIDRYLIETKNEKDIIPVDDLTRKIQVYVEDAGGDPSIFKRNGIGKYLNDLKIRKETVKDPATGKPCSSLIGYKYRFTSEVTEMG